NPRSYWVMLCALILCRMSLPSVGFVLTCIGAYLVSQQARYDGRMVPVYVMIIFGFLAMLIGIVNSHERQIQIFTVERCSRRQVTPSTLHEVVVSVEGAYMVWGLAPPLYTENSSESPDCRWSWEHPPRYSLKIEGLQLTIVLEID
uniref:Uncharacterized protein n=1 Tax=Cyprinodon variegatus TaxID=28743 RepID=A0A3Q2CUT5_CYPVA